MCRRQNSEIYRLDDRIRSFRQGNHHDLVVNYQKFLGIEVIRIMVMHEGDTK